MIGKIDINNPDERGLLPYPVILAATKGDPDAMKIVMQHYASYIAYLSTRKVRDEYGNIYYGIDEDSEKRMFEVVIVWKLDRFSRNRYDSATYKTRLKKNGVRVVSAKEQISDTPEGIILESMLEGMAEYYSADLAVKITRGMKENALKCRYNGGGMPFGYMVGPDQKLVINPQTAPIVVEIFQRYANGENIVS